MDEPFTGGRSREVTFQQLKNLVEQARGKYQRIQTELNTILAEIESLERTQVDILEAREIMRTVAQTTQQQLEYFISDIVSIANSAVFRYPYEFKAEFVLKRGKTECELFFIRNGQRLKPLDAAGGGPIDVSSFALRMSLWSLNKNRPVIVLDEPFKHLSKNLHAKALQMLKEISQKLSVQIIMITHSDELIDEADKVIELKIDKGVTKVI